MRISIYCRKSVSTGKGESIENQEALCRAHILEKVPGGGEAQVTVYRDEGFSGKDLDRPEFRRMMADAAREKPDYIVCYRLDRISRSVGDFAAFIEDLLGRDIAFLCIKEQFDTTNPMSKAMMYIASVFAQLERETIAERVRDNMLLLARTGRWLGGTPPTGYRSERVEEVVVEGRRRTACRLDWDPEEIGTARRIFQTFLERRSLAGTAKALRAAGVRSRQGTPFSLAGLRELLQNPVYCAADGEARAYFLAAGADVCFSEAECGADRGLLAYCKRDYGKKGAPRQGKGDWIVAVGRHRGILSGVEWVEVQKILDRQRAPRGSGPKNGYALLSGVLRCARCGGRMFAKTRSGDPAKFDYICERKLRYGAAACALPNLNGPEADARLTAALLPLLGEDPEFPVLLEARRAALCRGTDGEEERRRLTAQIGRLVSALARPGLSGQAAGEIQGRMEALCERRRGLEGRPAADRAELEALARELSTLPGMWRNLTVPQRRELLRLALDRAEWDGSDVRLYPKVALTEGADSRP